MKVTTARLFVAGCVTTGLLVILFSYLVSQTPGNVLGSDLLGPLVSSPSHDQVDYTLEEGRSASQVADDLERLGVIRSAAQFKALISLMGMQDQLSAGDYRLARGSSAASIIDQVTVKESVPTLRVTFPEGIRIEEMAVLAEKAGFGTQQEFLDAVAAAKLPPGLAESLPADDSGVQGIRLQGYLFPDTYILPEGATAAELVEMMIETFNERFSVELRAAVKARGLTLHQALTLASIVEREAVIADERPLIAGVFLNRLAAGDLLGADPTTQFVAALDPASVDRFGWWKKELTILDLENQSPYNTREVPGLPPGPITNPGLASIEAVANPAQTTMYYFVADAQKNDGSHVFAETLEEHERNKSLYGAQ